MWKKLIQSLDDLSDAYESLLAIEGKKRAVLVAVDLKGLETLVGEEEKQLERIRAAEKRRRDALLALSKEFPVSAARTTMKEVEAACPKNFRGKLHELHVRVGRRASEAKEAGGMNEFLIRQALGAVEYHLNRISNSSIDPTYGQKGQENVTREKKFDFQA
ncbi:MAG: flagellar protein FlgN [Schwartzia sp.]|nr:flagellar protein FlgN [Schwartzia sp. (in: firmicutes)]MBR1759951.1 flagellar protein FlgN [Schwartzia sp. (in: firmicutes)]MBR1886320.1 flagellar protein FlgN [Schwartzia sp. (in: firmicutes)]